MVNGRRLDKTTEAGKNAPALTRDTSESTPEFAAFREGMKRIFAVPKAELDEQVRLAKADSPRAGNPKAAGRKRKPQLDG